MPPMGQRKLDDDDDDDDNGYFLVKYTLEATAIANDTQSSTINGFFSLVKSA